jgi:hypothetical protein
MRSIMTRLGPIVIGLGFAAAVVLAVVVIGPILADGFTTLARPHGV